MDVRVVVDEGPKAIITAIDFDGNSTLSDVELRLAMDTQRGRINAEGGMYQADSLDADVLRILALYYERGMLAADVRAPEVSPSADRQSVVIRIPIREGPVFRVGKLEFRGDLLGSRKDYEALVSVRPGAVFRRSAIQQDLEAIRQYHLRKGRSELDVQPETALDPGTGTVDLTLRIEKRK